jgi:hypothetical protein
MNIKITYATLRELYKKNKKIHATSLVYSKCTLESWGWSVSAAAEYRSGEGCKARPARPELHQAQRPKSGSD